MRLFWLKLVMLAVTVLSLQSAFAQDKRVALVIGNADYRNIFKLKNPVNDATDIGAALSRMGFSVTMLNNATAEQMHDALAAFGGKAKQADYAVVFYAGHAIQAHGVNWLIPVDGSVDTLLDVANHSITLDEIVGQMAGAEQLAVVLLDAARNNPFPESKTLPRTTPQAATPKNLLIGYATGPGQKVSDGEGRDSPYTRALLRHIETPGLDVADLVKRVRDDVVKATAAKQIPFFHMSGPDEAVYLVPPR
ncbi:caspase family protein [Pseudorhodoplanes sinuspersici]|nr:caspase family protein [Pseudorhodoplanes sinuspersici]RKE67689.1 caspase domain-containing protein [Pseudorhodoplanes sinuspersici]